MVRIVYSLGTHCASTVVESMRRHKSAFVGFSTAASCLLVELRRVQASIHLVLVSWLSSGLAAGASTFTGEGGGEEISERARSSIRSSYLPKYLKLIGYL